jgi:putative tryptophan/tyrosine transport system substrate-binding protein
MNVKRRDFITLLGGAATWPVAARAQQPGKVPTIGILNTSTPAVSGRLWDAFIERLRALGWIDGRNIAIEYRWAEGRTERFAAIAAEFVRLNVNVIVTVGTAAVVSAKKATSAIPIVFTIAGDPVGTGLVASLARPGGNVTGMSGQQTDTAAKRLGFLREVVPGLRGLAILGNIDSAGAVSDMHEVEAMARSLGLMPIPLEIRRAEDIAVAFDRIKGRAEALYVVIDPLLNAEQIRINSLALGAHLPTVHDNRDSVETGGLISYGPNRPGLYRRAGDLVDKILHGAKPVDIPVEQPTKWELVINLKTAKALGLTVPDTLLALADEVIE